MTTRSAARRSLLYALLELERVDDGALDAAFHHAQRAAFCILDLRGTTDPVNLDRSSVPVPSVPPAATGLHSDGRSASWPVAAPPSDTRPPGNRESGGGNP